jgi:hypothetical protein
MASNLTCGCLARSEDEGEDGFIGKNADAFEITGYGRDALPGFMGVWAWGDLEI